MSEIILMNVLTKFDFDGLKFILDFIKNIKNKPYNDILYVSDSNCYHQYIKSQNPQIQFIDYEDFGKYEDKYRHDKLNNRLFIFDINYRHKTPRQKSDINQYILNNHYITPKLYHSAIYLYTSFYDMNKGLYGSSLVILNYDFAKGEKSTIRRNWALEYDIKDSYLSILASRDCMRYEYGKRGNYGYSHIYDIEETYLNSDTYKNIQHYFFYYNEPYIYKYKEIYYEPYCQKEHRDYFNKYINI